MYQGVNLILPPPPPPLPLPHSKHLYLRQLRNNQNQLNTTGGQNLNEFNDTAGWLSGFCNELIKSSQPQITLPLPNQPENKKGNCSNLVIWTSTMTNIRIQKLFVIGNLFFFISQIKKQQRMSV